MKKIIVISGKQYSGKDTLAKMLLKKLNNFKRIGIGDAIKLELCKNKNISLEEVLKNKHLYRDELIKLGNYGRSISDDYWLKKLANLENIIVPDIRMRFEADFFKAQGAFLIRINSNLINRSKRGVIVSSDDKTETDLDNYNNWDIVVENNSDLANLDNIADIIVNQLS